MRKNKKQAGLVTEPNAMLVKYKIQNVELRSLSLNMEDANLTHDSIDLTFEISGFYEIKKEQNFLEFHIDARTFADAKKNKLIASIHTVTTFDVVNMKDFISADNKAKFPELLLRECFSTSYSTTRGMFFSKCIETRLGKVILPLLDPLKHTHE